MILASTFDHSPHPIAILVATIFGMLPLAAGVGSRAQLLQPPAIAVIGRVGVSIPLCLVVSSGLFLRAEEEALNL